MRVLRAEALGMCFGVRDALVVLDAVPDPGRATILGELVHNEVVLDRLRGRGFAMVGEADRDRAPGTPEVVVTAHGLSDTARGRLEAAGTRLIDTTCPLVLRVHLAARNLRSRGYHILVVGRPGHVEVRGIVEDLDAFDIVPDPEAVRTYPQDRLGVVCQTTVSPRRVQEIRAAIEARNPHAEIRFVDTTCQPTRDRQHALERLLGQVEALVVVGGSHSNNTRELVALGRERGLPTWHVQGAADLDSSWFAGIGVVGLTAGTSTLDETIAEVERALGAIGGQEQAPMAVGGLAHSHSRPHELAGGTDAIPSGIS
jgi:4-hydroxy-3-methylbut-2-enyl diphosphate reductase